MVVTNIVSEKWMPKWIHRVVYPTKICQLGRKMMVPRHKNDQYTGRTEEYSNYYQWIFIFEADCRNNRLKYFQEKIGEILYLMINSNVISVFLRSVRKNVLSLMAIQKFWNC